MRRSLFALGLTVAGCSPSSDAPAPAASSAPAVSSPAAPPPAASSEAPPVAPPASSSAPASAAPASCPEGTVLVTGGVFWMGTPGGADEEVPRHQVAVRSYCMDTFEITVAEWKRCVDDGACTPARPDREGCTAGMKNKDDHPVNCVDWNQADAYCKAHHGRLPSEREWEYAARGGSEQRAYPWGNDPPDGRSCYAHPGTCKVGSYKPHAFGIHDLGGNVWEWTSSFFGAYPKEQTEGALKVYRGGSYSRRFPKWMRNGLRNRMRMTEWGAHLGARCAHDLPGATCPAGSHDDDGRCVLDGDTSPPPKPTWQAAGPGAPGTAAAPPVSKEPPKEPAPVTMTRDPQFDDDCKKHKPGRPVCYALRGGTFAERQAKKGSCSNRDVSVGWNSICCAQ